MSKKPAQPQDKYVLRLPDGMRDRIKAQADRNGRSMNAEIVRALEQFFPPEPTTEEIIERVHQAIALSMNSEAMPYRRVLVDALDEFADRLSKGIEFDQFRSTTSPDWSDSLRDAAARIRRWHRAQEHGVEQSDLEEEIEKGLLKFVSKMSAHAALQLFKEGEPHRALQALHLDRIKFAEPEAAYKAIEKYLREIYEENWGNPDEPFFPED